MNSVGIPEGFRATLGCLGTSGVGVVSGDLGPHKAFAQMATLSMLYMGGRSPSSPIGVFLSWRFPSTSLMLLPELLQKLIGEFLGIF